MTFLTSLSVSRVDCKLRAHGRMIEATCGLVDVTALYLQSQFEICQEGIDG